MRAVGGFLRAQIAEIERDDASRWYGAAMAFLHVVPYLYWVDQRIAAFIHAQAEPICWPLVPRCEGLRVLSAAGVTLLLRAYFAAAVGAGLLFAFRRLVPWAYVSLELVNALKLAIMLLDYRLRMNQHYMGFFATFAYLFVPDKRNALRVLVTLFYFWAGDRKSTRLNSSHGYISYAVFCLKKKKKTHHALRGRSPCRRGTKRRPHSLAYT